MGEGCGKYYHKTVTSILAGHSEYEKKIKDMISNNVSRFITSANDGFRTLKHRNKLPKEWRLNYSSFTGTATGILIEFYLAKYSGEKYRNTKVNSSVEDILSDGDAKKTKKVSLIYTRKWLTKAYDKINSSNLEDIEKLADLAMDFAALESYYRCEKEQCFDVVKCRNETNIKHTLYEIIREDVIELYKAFKKTAIKEQILTCKDIIIINPNFTNNFLKGDGDFFINGVLYDLKCLNNSNYEISNSLQLMFYYILNEINKFPDKFPNISTTCCNPRAGLDIKELKVFNPRYEAVMKFDIRLKMDLIELGKEIMKLIISNSKLYYDIFEYTISEFSNRNDFLKLDNANKIKEIDIFFKINNKYRFIMENDDCYDFIQNIINKIEKQNEQKVTL